MKDWLGGMNKMSSEMMTPNVSLEQQMDSLS